MPRLWYRYILKTYVKNILLSINSYVNASCFNRCQLGSFLWPYLRGLVLLPCSILTRNKKIQTEKKKKTNNNADVQRGFWEDNWPVFPSLWTSLRAHRTPSPMVGTDSSSKMVSGLEEQNPNPSQKETPPNRTEETHRNERAGDVWGTWHGIVQWA